MKMSLKMVLVAAIFVCVAQKSCASTITLQQGPADSFGSPEAFRPSILDDVFWLIAETVNPILGALFNVPSDINDFLGGYAYPVLFRIIIDTADSVYDPLVDAVAVELAEGNDTLREIVFGVFNGFRRAITELTQGVLRITSVHGVEATQVIIDMAGALENLGTGYTDVLYTISSLDNFSLEKLISCSANYVQAVITSRLAWDVDHTVRTLFNATAASLNESENVQSLVTQLQEAVHRLPGAAKEFSAVVEDALTTCLNSEKKI